VVCVADFDVGEGDIVYRLKKHGKIKVEVKGVYVNA